MSRVVIIIFCLLFISSIAKDIKGCALTLHFKMVSLLQRTVIVCVAPPSGESKEDSVGIHSTCVRNASACSGNPAVVK